MKTNLYLLALCWMLLQSCVNRDPVASRADYESYIALPVRTSDNSNAEEMKFWRDRLNKDTGDETALTKLAGLYSERFKSTGIVGDIQASDSLFHTALEMSDDDVNIYQTLAANAITQHRFRQAAVYADKALALKDKKAASLLILADVSLELGDVAAANQILRQFTNKNSFAYLIRAAKVKDHEGHLDSAIIMMEKAYERIKGNKGTAQWTLSNLADMYGHAGRIREAYDAYLTVLKNDPRDGYALKGIAWIALSNDHNVKDAEEIITSLASRKRMPEAYLMLAETASLKGDIKSKTECLSRFIEMASTDGYKTMYNKYLANIKADEFDDAEGCIAIAKAEIQNRPTPQSYDLLAWGYYTKKEYVRALEISTKYVVDQTHEPEAIFHTGMIYRAAGKNDEARRYLKDAKGSSFELGPTVTKKIEKALRTL